MIQILKNIKSVSVIEAKDLANVHFVPGIGAFLDHWRPFDELPVVGLAECSVASAIENRSRVFTTKLTAHLSAHFDVAGHDLCFMIGTVDGERYLIGMSESPYPVVNTEDVMPDRASDKSGCILSVEYKDTLGLLPVLD